MGIGGEEPLPYHTHYTGNDDQDSAGFLQGGSASLNLLVIAFIAITVYGINTLYQYIVKKNNPESQNESMLSKDPDQIVNEWEENYAEFLANFVSLGCHTPHKCPVKLRYKNRSVTTRGSRGKSIAEASCKQLSNVASIDATCNVNDGFKHAPCDNINCIETAIPENTELCMEPSRKNRSHCHGYHNYLASLGSLGTGTKNVTPKNDLLTKNLTAMLTADLNSGPLSAGSIFQSGGRASGRPPNRASTYPGKATNRRVESKLRR